MEKVNALELRQSLSKIIKRLQRSGEPLLLEKGRQAAAVLISLDDYKKRFVDKYADEKRRALQQKIMDLSRPSKVKKSAEDLIRELRSGEIY